MNRIQSKDHRIYGINKIYFSCFNDKIYIKKYGCDGLGVIKNSYHNNYSKKLFSPSNSFIFFF